MEQEQKEQGPTLKQGIVFMSILTVMGMMLLIHVHWGTFRRWTEALFWVLVGVIVMTFIVVVILLIKGIEIPTSRTDWYMWLMQRKINRVRKGRPDKKLSEREKEHVQKIQNHYEGKIDELYDRV